MSARASVLPLILCALLAPQASVAAQESCRLCHGELGQRERAGVHERAGIQCIDCHGGTPGALEAKAAHAGGSRLPSGPRASVELCGTCHADPVRMSGFDQRTDALLLFRTSAHGRRLEVADDPEVATCVSCHDSHGILSAADARSPVHALRQAETCARCHADAELMARHALPSDPPAQYRLSVHARALAEGQLASPTCSDCHGAHGATPPRVDTVGRTCGRCHGSVLEAFETSPHGAAARAGKLEECVSCHGNHAVERPTSALLVGTEAGHCGSCHADDPAATELGTGLLAALRDYDESLATAERELESAAASGLDIGPETRWLREAESLRQRAGARLHALSTQGLRELFEPGRGLLGEALDGLAEKRRESSDRRILVLVFLGTVLLLALTLWLLSREVAGRSVPGATRAVGSSGGAGGAS